MLVYSAYGTAACVARINGIPKPACVSGCVSRVTMTSTSVITISPLLCLKRQVVHFSFYFLNLFDCPLLRVDESQNDIKTPSTLVIIYKERVAVVDVPDARYHVPRFFQCLIAGETEPVMRLLCQLHRSGEVAAIRGDTERHGRLLRSHLLDVGRLWHIFDRAGSRLKRTRLRHPDIRIRRARRGLIGQDDRGTNLGGK